MSGDIEIALLGPVAARMGRHSIPLTPLEMGTLAILALSPRRAVAMELMIDALWGDEPPASARSRLHSLVSGLRRKLGPVMATREPGYALELPDSSIDVRIFERRLDSSRTAALQGKYEIAQRELRAALLLWRGPPLVGATPPIIDAEAPRLSELYLGAIEKRVELDIRLGQHAALLPELTKLVSEYPFRERLRSHLMLALHRAGRQTEAGESFRQLRRQLLEKFGTDPSDDLRRLYVDISRDAPHLTLEFANSPNHDAAVPHQLPAGVSDFVGRISELKELAVLESCGEDSGRVILIVGSGGVGKTALAIHWAHRIAQLFPGGQLFANLRGYDGIAPSRPLDVLASFLRALGIPNERIPADLSSASQLYRSLMTGRRTLVVLDNARSHDQLLPLLPDAPGCLVLATSRDRLAEIGSGDGVRRLTLESLSSDEAIELLVRILGAQRVQAGSRAAANLVRACGLLPLAVRIAAAQLTDRPERSVADFVMDLNGGNRLSGLTISGDNQSSMRTIFDHSYDVLSSGAKRLFRLLGHSPAVDITAEATAALGSLCVDEAGRALQNLAGAHLITEQANDRYAMHDLTRAYAKELAGVDGELDEAVVRLLRWHLDAVTSAAGRLYPEKLRLPSSRWGGGPSVDFADRISARDWLDCERDNLVVAVAHAAKHGAPEMAWLISDALRGYFWMGGPVTTWRAVAGDALATARIHGRADAEVAALMSLGMSEIYLGRHGDAVRTYMKALDVARRAGWGDGLAAVLGSLGTTHMHSGRPADAVKYLREAAALNRENGRLVGEANDLSNLGYVYRPLGMLAESRNAHQQALAIYRRAGSVPGEAFALHGLALTALLAGDLAEAWNLLGRARIIYVELGDQYREGDAYADISTIHCVAERSAEAADAARAALEIAERIGQASVEAHARIALAHACNGGGDPRQAQDHFSRALETARTINHREYEIRALVGLSIVRESAEAARKDVLTALSICDEVGHVILEGEARMALAHVDLRAGDHLRAIDNADAAVRLHRRSGNRLGEARALNMLAKAVGRTGNIDRARSYSRMADAISTEAGVTRREFADKTGG